MLWGFLSRYAPQAGPESAPFLDRLVDHALAYYRDFVKPAKHYRPPTEMELAALNDLADTLSNLPAEADAESIQTALYEVGKRHPFDSLRAWFQALYEILFGQSEGPRIGSFFALYGLPETVTLLRRAIASDGLAIPPEARVDSSAPPDSGVPDGAYRPWDRFPYPSPG